MRFLLFLCLLCILWEQPLVQTADGAVGEGGKVLFPEAEGGRIEGLAVHADVGEALCVGARGGILYERGHDALAAEVGMAVSAAKMRDVGEFIQIGFAVVTEDGRGDGFAADAGDEDLIA